ncbi:DUF4221 family protein [Mongoliitalea daihaiensis]|uniref:DUF4221 family protein n=1 Tax=Mongoliitalea daihaiensis TaxID=2782006 RepID=UPI001F253D9C|nr:DUF4221 family protein [Mongoliitalea daihaiensis]UJP66529.1 DUF4221 family protein [Mongoliitalea daihaiensis]
MKFAKLFNTLILLVSSLIFLFSCSSTQDTKTPIVFYGPIEEIILDTVYIEKDLETSRLPSTFMYDASSRSLISLAQNSLFTVPYPELTPVNKQLLEKEGPDGIGTFSYGGLITDDYIFILNSPKELIQLDKKGKVLKRIPFPLDSKIPNALFNILKGQQISWDKENQRLIIPLVPFVLKEESFENNPWIWEADFTSDEIRPLASFTFPELYKEFLEDVELGTFYNTYHPKLQAQVISMPASDSLLLIHADRQEWKYAGSSEKLQFLKGKTEQYGEMIAFLPNHESSRYGAITWDPYRNHFVRNLIISEKKVNDKVIRDHRLLFFDADFQKLAEISFNADIISRTPFFTPDGVYLKLLDAESDDYEGYVRLKTEF